jgi:hypothetical protein
MTGMASKEKGSKEKPFDKMTATELREVAKEIPDITGVHGMNKPELIAAIKAARGIKDEKVKKADTSIRDIKKKIKLLKDKQEAAAKTNNKKMTAICRRRISRLKKKTRRAAA